ncbi:TcdA/TcdB pore-forming domain-containing protein, partial [Vibrio cholerae]|uniref:TcdA/TcdB pore-forming domain-containing protein n=2 Tax=Gammaproteobacteria TaxID=1236 RepID=UPI000A2396E3
KNNEESSRWIETYDKTFFEFKQYSYESMRSFSEHYTFNDLELQHEGCLSDTEHVDGLNSAIGIKTLIEWSANRNRQS